MSLLGNLLGVGGPQQNQFGGPLGKLMSIANIGQKFQQFSQNPVASLLNMNPNLSIPQNLMNNPEAAVKHLLSTGQMTQEEYNQFGNLVNPFQSMLPRF